MGDILLKNGPNRNEYILIHLDSVKSSKCGGYANYFNGFGDLQPPTELISFLLEVIIPSVKYDTTLKISEHSTISQ